MTLEELLLLLPVLVVSAGILIVMLQTAWKRNPGLAQFLTLLTLALTIVILIVHYPQRSHSLTLLFEMDPIGAFFALLVCLCCFSVALLQGSYMGPDSPEVAEEFDLLLLLSALGGILLVLASHVAGALLGVELMGLSLLAMLAYNRQRLLSLEATLKYLLLSGASTSMFIMGFGFLYASSGSLVLETMLTPPMTLLSKAGLVLVFASLAFKLSLVPLHIWTPDVYHGAPCNSTLLLTSLSKTAVFAILMKLLLAVPAEFATELAKMLSWMAIASMLLGNWLALQQTSIKRLMAYSAIAHMGYVLVAGIIAIGVDDSLVIEGAGYYLLAYLVASILIFSVLVFLSSLNQQQDTDELSQLQGLFWHHPWLAVALTLAFLSLAGMPITVGFIGKFYLLTLAVELNAWWLVSAMVIGSAVALYYYLRVIFSLYAEQQEIPLTVTSSIFSRSWVSLITIVLIALGILPGLLGDQLPALLAIR